MKLAIALFGDHGGELDRHVIETTDDRSGDDLRDVMLRLVDG